MFFVYILECADGTLYTGSTNDLDKRLHAHNHLKSGAHYTKIRRPVVLKYKEEFDSFREMRKRENEIKSLSKQQKLELIKSIKVEQKVKKQFIAVRAIIEKDGKFLVIRESDKYKTGTNKGKYDFPGGKVELGESIDDAIKREVKEETGMKVQIIKPFLVDEWRPIVKGEQLQIIGIFFLCGSSSKKIKLSVDHDDYKWLSIKDYSNYPLNKATSNAFNELSLIQN